MSKSSPVIGVIEWSSDSALEPDVFLGDSAEQVKAAVVERLWPMIEDISYIDAPWIRQHPKPDTADAAAVSAWLDELREATTDAWLTLYTPAEQTGSDTFHDLRS